MYRLQFCRHFVGWGSGWRWSKTDVYDQSTAASGKYRLLWHTFVNSLRPRQNGRCNTDDTFKCIFLNENVWIPTKISLKFVPRGPINDISVLVQIMAWRRPGDKPLSELMMVSLLTHICVTRPQGANIHIAYTRMPEWSGRHSADKIFKCIHLKKFVFY